MSLSADEILACTTAHELFGEAVHDRRGLKRAYAGLIKAWGPDAHPEVFRHIRDLYEAAKRGDTGAPEPEPERPALRLVTSDEPENEPEPELDAPPAERLRAAMEAGDPDRALEVLDAHDLDLRIDHPGLWFASVATLADLRTFSLPAEVLQSWLDAVDGAPDMIPATMLDRIELLTGTGVAYQAARQDESIEPALLDLLALWGKDAVTVAEGFIALGGALPDDEAAWAAHQALKVRYPGLWFPYSLLKNQVTREVDSYDESKAPHLDTAPPAHLARAVGHDPSRQHLAETIDNLRIAGAIVLLLAFPAAIYVDSWRLLVLSGAGAAVFSVLTFVGTRMEARKARLSYLTAQPVLVDYAKQNVLFHHEVLDLALPDSTEPPPSALCRWQQDPTTLLRILTPAHLDRIRARDAQPAETE